MPDHGNHPILPGLERLPERRCDRNRARLALCDALRSVARGRPAKAMRAFAGVPAKTNRASRALRELGRIRRVTMTIGERTIERDTRHSAL